MIVVMKDRKFCKMVWNTVEGTESNVQVVGLQDRVACRICSVARVKKM